MDKKEINIFLKSFELQYSRTLVIIDFANVEKWKDNLGWKIGIQELARLVKNFTKGDKKLRRFYYGSDYGPNDKSDYMNDWSYNILERAKSNGFEVITKRVKYIHSTLSLNGFIKKCDLDVEMTVDILSMKDAFDQILIFSGDGDITYALQYLKNSFNKKIYVFGARNSIGREIIDALNQGIICKVIYIEDFQYRLNMDRFRYK
jgi:uncharacterized LabA/DUF88 family protein